MIITATLFIIATTLAECAVLDPALYLVPSPPLVQARDSVPPAEMWGRSLEERTKKFSDDNVKIALTTEKPAAVGSRMFWPRFASSEPVLDVHVPLTFSLSGSYGKGSPIPSTVTIPSGVIANTYTSVTGIATPGSSNPSSLSTFGSTLRSSLPLFGRTAVATVYGNYGRSALAGSSYGNYGGVRVYGGDNAASWSGWGNGKWGHYGKG